MTPPNRGQSATLLEVANKRITNLHLKRGWSEQGRDVMPPFRPSPSFVFTRARRLRMPCQHDKYADRCNIFPRFGLSVFINL